MKKIYGLLYHNGINVIQGADKKKFQILFTSFFIPVFNLHDYWHLLDEGKFQTSNYQNSQSFQMLEEIWKALFSLPSDNRHDTTDGHHDFSFIF